MLYTVIINFEDHTFAINQYETDSPEEALMRCIKESEALEDYDRSKIINIFRGQKKY